jgi:hypothetical protein
MPGVSQIVPLFFQELDPSVPIGRLVKIAEDARKEWTGRRQRFRELFPGYGLHIAPDFSLVSQSEELVAHFKPNIPTYFH